jgi:hypothetical protein
MPLQNFLGHSLRGKVRGVDEIEVVENCVTIHSSLDVDGVFDAKERETSRRVGKVF